MNKQEEEEIKNNPLWTRDFQLPLPIHYTFEHSCCVFKDACPTCYKTKCIYEDGMPIDNKYDSLYINRPCIKEIPKELTLLRSIRLGPHSVIKNIPKELINLEYLTIESDPLLKKYKKPSLEYIPSTFRKMIKIEYPFYDSLEDCTLVQKYHECARYDNSAFFF